jgi:hypothetical protein
MSCDIPAANAVQGSFKYPEEMACCLPQSGMAA